MSMNKNFDRIFILLQTAVECSPFLNVSDRHMYANDNLQSMDPTQVKSVRVHGNPYIRETLDLLDDENFPSQVNNLKLH